MRYTSNLKGICHEEIAVQGQFCAEVITKSLYPYTNRGTQRRFPPARCIKNTF